MNETTELDPTYPCDDTAIATAACFEELPGYNEWVDERDRAAGEIAWAEAELDEAKIPQ
jgi:hypothetical protein